MISVYPQPPKTITARPHLPHAHPPQGDQVHAHICKLEEGHMRPPKTHVRLLAFATPPTTRSCTAVIAPAHPTRAPCRILFDNICTPSDCLQRAQQENDNYIATARRRRDQQALRTTSVALGQTESVNSAEFIG